jgi:hypothetical protein
MSFVPVMWTVWAAIAVITASLMIYRSNLTKDEEDQIFLDDSFDHERAAQAAIVAKANKLQPILKVSEILVVVASIFVIGYYIMDFIRQFR